MAGAVHESQRFFVEIIKPSHYDDDGYVIQWQRAFVPSNSLACLYALVQDVAQRRLLGDNVTIEPRVYDESHTVIPVKQVISRIRAGGNRGVVFLAGVQTNQFPRAADLAAEFRAADIPVVIGGFHVSGCLAMLPEMPLELKKVQEMGVTLFAGEAEGRMASLLDDVYGGRLQPVYNYLGDLPNLQGCPTPQLPRDVAARSMFFVPFDAGRGCPFACSFCTIINVQGRRSRFRGADDIEQVVRTNLQQGIRRFFITDDNMARNKNWEPIFDRLIALREKEGARLKLIIQVDTLSHKIPGFIEKAARAGCNRIFIGLENINPENLRAANKRQNCVDDYREMLQAWRAHHVLTHAGYILGLPDDTPESIERDIRIIQQELPIDILEFMLLTPLPGSADHKALCEQGVRLDPDLNKYDVEHVVAPHERMTAEQWQEIYHRAWHLYYSPEHVKTLLRRARVNGAGMRHLSAAILAYYGSFRFEGLHPLQCGLLRRKVRATRRPGLPRENPFLFYPRQVWETVSTWTGIGLYHLELERIRRRLQKDPSAAEYTDRALSTDGQGISLPSPSAILPHLKKSPRVFGSA